MRQFIDVSGYCRNSGLGSADYGHLGNYQSFCFRQLFEVGKETDSMALVADGWHLRTDVWTSAGVALDYLFTIWVVYSSITDLPLS